MLKKSCSSTSVSPTAIGPLGQRRMAALRSLLRRSATQARQQPKDTAHGQYDDNTELHCSRSPSYHLARDSTCCSCCPVLCAFAYSRPIRGQSLNDVQDAAALFGPASLRAASAAMLCLPHVCGHPGTAAVHACAASPSIAPPTQQHCHAETSDVRRITILHFNDVYNIQPGEVDPIGGAARFVHKCNELQKEHNALVLFSGDVFNPSQMSNVTKGEQMPPVLNAAGVQASVVGNHDLDFVRLEPFLLCSRPYAHCGPFCIHDA